MEPVDSSDATRDRSRADRLWVWWASIASAVIVGYFFTQSPVQNLMWDALGVVLVGAVITGVRIHRPEAPTAWYLIAAGIALLALGDLTWDTYDLVLHREAPFPSVADWFYLSGYPFLAAGLAVMLHRRLPSPDRASLIDASILAVGGSVVMWVLVGRGYALDSSLSVVERLSAVAYPAGDLLLLGMIARLAFAPGARSASYRLLTLALLVTIVGDTVYGHLVLAGTYEVGGPLDMTWMAAYLCWGAAALHPSMRSMTEPGAERTSPLNGRRLLTLVGASLLSPIILGGQAIAGDHRGLPVMVGTSVILFLLVVARMAGLARTMTAAAMADPLTGLPNRRQLMAKMVARERRAESSPVALLFLDLDRFKLVNDSLGHDAGDELLRIVGSRLQSAVRDKDVVSRLGGDEFVIVAEVSDEAEATALAARVQEHLRWPVQLEDRSVVITASIGVAMRVDGAAATAELLRDADAAMYVAKQTGKARSVLWAPSGIQPDVLGLEAELRLAIARQELVVHYQPVVCFDDNSIVGAEALVRWSHPARGLLAPSEFLSAAEDSGLIVQLGELVLSQACQARQRLVTSGLVGSDFVIAVNLSPRQLREPGLVDHIMSIVEQTQTPPESVCLEITENAAVDQGSEQMAVVMALAEQGLGIAIDDFGTGFSSLTSLRDLPVRAIKLDQSFVTGLGADDYDSAISAAVVGLAQRLGLRNVAEGVETVEQLNELRRLGFSLGQGYLWSPAVALDELCRILAESPRLATSPR